MKMELKTNVGGLDSFIRIFVGIVLAYSALMGYIGAWGYIGLVLVATGLGRTCPAYCVIGANTEKDEAAGH